MKRKTFRYTKAKRFCHYSATLQEVLRKEFRQKEYILHEHTNLHNGIKSTGNGNWSYIVYSM